MKFLDIRTDFAFKKVFGSRESKPRLISFLNSVIEFNDHCQITELEIVDPYNVPQLKGMKDTYVDVKAILTDATIVIIEMQVINHDGFEKRVLYNAAKNYSIQLDKGERYHLLKPVIALTIVNFEMFNDNDEMINTFQLINKKTLTTYNHDIQLIFIELKKFTKTQQECQGIQDDWIFFLKNAGDLSMIPKNLPQQVLSAYEVSNEAGMSKEELELQHKKKEWISMQISAFTLAERKGNEQGKAEGIAQGKPQGIAQGKAEGIVQGKAKGIAQGKAEGIAKGKAEAMKWLAINLLIDGEMSDEKVVQMTGLSLAEVLALKAQ
jgi:predicted transposase/invertase (TIGR01784 family)